MNIKHIILLGASLGLVSCAAPSQPIYVVQQPTPTTSYKPTYKKPAYCPPTKKYSSTTESAPTGGRNVQGVFIRDTPPEEVEPARTIGVELNQ